METNKKKKKLDLIKAGFLLTSLYGVIACIAIVVSVVFAWYTDQVQVEDNKIHTSVYGVTVGIKADGSTINPVDGTPLQYILDAGKEYEITLTAKGSAKTGYCTVTITGNSSQGIEYTDTYSSSPLQNSIGDNQEEVHGAIKFTLTLGDTVTVITDKGESKVAIEKWTITFTPSWGECSEEDNIVKESDVVKIGSEATSE